MRNIDHFYMQHTESINGCLLALKNIILRQDVQISAAWKYGMPFFCFGNTMFCYLWVHKKLQQPYLGIVEGASIHHPLLISENRSRMKIMLFDPEMDLPVKTIETILQQALLLYRTV